MSHKPFSDNTKVLRKQLSVIVRYDVSKMFQSILRITVVTHQVTSLALDDTVYRARLISWLERVGADMDAPLHVRFEETQQAYTYEMHVQMAPPF